MGAQLAMTNDDPIDLRSDTKTLPTEEMLDAMRRAELGDSKAVSIMLICPLRSFSSCLY